MPEIETQRRILEVAIELFAQRGFAGTSMRHIASALELTTAALYYHFDSKDALLESASLEFLENLEALAGGPIGAHDSETKRTLLGGYMNLIASDVNLSRVMAYDPAVQAHPSVGPRLDDAVGELILRLTAPKSTPTNNMKAVAALGAIRRPVLELGVDPVDRTSLIAAAMAALLED